LEPDFYHIRGLSHSNSQGTCGAACQEAAPDASICGDMGAGAQSQLDLNSFPTSFFLTQTTMKVI
jgi:hypothetical protein